MIELESTITCPLRSILIGSRLDTDIHSNTCRLAFYGHVLTGFTDPDYTNKDLPSKLRIYKRKEKIGFVDRIVDSQSLIGKDLFRKETNINSFVNFRVELLPTGDQGFIESPFGQSGKFKVRFLSKKQKTKSDIQFDVLFRWFFFLSSRRNFRRNSSKFRRQQNSKTTKRNGNFRRESTCSNRSEIQEISIPRKNFDRSMRWTIVLIKMNKKTR